MRLKSVLAGVTAGLIGCAAITPFQYVSAYDLPPGTTTITGDMLHHIIGDSPTCYYVGANNEWVKVTGSFYAVEGFVGAGTTGISPNVWNGRNLCWYKFPVPSEYYTSTVISPIGMLDINLHFSNVTYIDFGMVAYNSNKYLNLPVGTVRPYCYLDYYIGTNQNRLYAASDTTGEHMGSMGVAGNYPPNYHYFANFNKYEGVATDFYYTSISSACLREYGSDLLIGIPAMIINSDYVLEVNGVPPTGGGGDSPVISGIGSLNGSLSENSSGGYDVNYDINIDLPDYTPYINPDWDSAQKERVDGARENVDQYHTAEDGLFSDADDALSSIPDMEFDQSLIEDAENPFSEFFGINIVGIMIFWVGAIAFISYILFGKWV